MGGKQKIFSLQEIWDTARISAICDWPLDRHSQFILQPKLFSHLLKWNSFQQLFPTVLLGGQVDGVSFSFQYNSTAISKKKKKSPLHQPSSEKPADCSSTWPWILSSWSREHRQLVHQCKSKTSEHLHDSIANETEVQNMFVHFKRSRDIPMYLRAKHRAKSLASMTAVVDVHSIYCLWMLWSFHVLSPHNQGIILQNPACHFYRRYPPGTPWRFSHRFLIMSRE